MPIEAPTKSDFISEHDIAKVVPNPNRTETLSTINLTTFLPDYLKGTEAQTFVEFFETYLNEMYEGTYRYVAPNLLSNISYPYPLMYVSGSDQVKSPNGKLTNYFSAGDYIQRSDDSRYYKIKSIANDTSAILTDFYDSANYSGAISGTYYYDDFAVPTMDDFWRVNRYPSPNGADGIFPEIYQIDVNNNRAICIDDSQSVVQIADGIKSISADAGDFALPGHDFWYPYATPQYNYGVGIKLPIGTYNVKLGYVKYNTPHVYSSGLVSKSFPIIINDGSSYDIKIVDVNQTLQLMISDTSDPMPDPSYDLGVWLSDDGGINYYLCDIYPQADSGSWWNPIIYAFDKTIPLVSNQTAGIEFNFGFYVSSGKTHNNKFGFKIQQNTGTDLFDIYYKDNFMYILQGGTEKAKVELGDNTSQFNVSATKAKIDGTWTFTLTNFVAKTATSTWADSSNSPVIGYHNKWSKVISVVEDPAGYMNYPYYILSILNGEGQGFDYVEFIADVGFKAQLDSVGGDYRKNITHISILEKIKRLTDLHDPDLIDVDYVNYFASYLGYNVDFTSDALLGILQSDPNYASYSEEEQEDIRQKYLRFLLSNIPSWYRIKTTNNSLNILLYSFGIAAQVKQYFTNTYSDPNTYIGTDVIIPNDFYETPHFYVKTNLDQNIQNLTADITKLDAVVKTINSVRPINTVFHGLTGYVERILPTYYMEMSASTMLHLTIR